jgi:RNA polymerase sigma factor (sigma-70 family)
MVLGVCRRVLSHEQEAEDAFQATFLVLMRRAGSLNRPELLGNWLYGVAFRTAQKARARLARRHYHETRVEPMPPTDPLADLYWHELRGVLDEELKQLPAKYRAPLVLCYLEGMTNEEAAHRLGWPVGSMSYRLARGRQMLRERLGNRRQALTALPLLALLRTHAAPQEVPSRLAEATLRAAVGTPPPPAPPAVVRADLASTPARLLWGTRRLILAIVGLVAVTTVAAAGGALYLNGGFGGGSRAADNAGAPGSGAPDAAVTSPVSSHCPLSSPASVQ